MRLRKGHVRRRVRHVVKWYTYGDYTASKSAMSSRTVVVACGLGCGTDSSGLRCRVNRTTTVDAEYDPERKAVCCAVPRDLVTPDIDYEVLDALGNLICSNTARSTSCGATSGKACGQAVVMEDTSDAKEPDAVEGRKSVWASMSWVDRLLPLWIIGAMVLGVVLGYYVPVARHALQVAEVGGVSLPIALGLWWMMFPVLCKVRYEVLHVLFKQRTVWKQILTSLALNWVVGPALMTALAWACLPDLPSYRNGVIMVGLARCIAMVLLWNQLARGDAELCAITVAINSIFQIVLYAPLSVFYIGVLSGGTVPLAFWPVCKAVLLFLGVPLVAGILLRVVLLWAKGRTWFDTRFMPWFGPTALVALVYTIIVMFAAQGDKIVNEIGHVARVAVPMLIYFFTMFVLSMVICWYNSTNYSYMVTQSFTAASNNFELAIAVAVATFGIQSAEALAATVGPLIEVPVLLALVYVALWVKGRWWEGRDQQLKAQGRFPPDLHAVLEGQGKATA